MENRDNFSNRFGVLVALTGSAVGLGNLWRFPYLVGNNGGAAFIIIYLFFVIVLCLPIMFSEFVLGRRTQANVFGVFKSLAPGSNWGVIGLLCVFAAISILSFYSVVGGWTLNYLVDSFSFKASTHSQEELFSVFHNISSSTWRPIIYLGLFLLLNILVIIAGVKKGIERYTKFMMPVLFLLVIIIAICSLTLDGSSKGVSFFFKPDFSKVTGQTVLAALGQAFFSLSIGCGTTMTYASYVKKNENIMKVSSLTAISDTVFAIIAGLAIMPAVFSFGISPSEGPGLVFVTLPHIFSQIPGGGIMSIMFFFILFFAALTSSISLLEVIVAYMKEEFHIKRVWSSIICFVILLGTGSLCSLSQGTLSEVKPLGSNFFDLFDKLSSNILLPIIGLLVVLFVGWKLGKSNFKDEMTNSGTLSIKKWLFEFIYFIIKFVAPIVIVTILISGLF